MFGYVTPVKDKLRQQDFVLYRSFYCGICAQIGRDYGALPRFTTTYDATFLALLSHDVTEQEVEFEESRCIGNPFTKKLMIKGNELLKRVCASNVILSYYKLYDDVIDEGGVKKRLARAAMNKAYKKAVYLMPAVDEIVKRRYEELRKMEKSGEGSVDKVAHCFAMLLRETCEVVVKGKCDENFLSLCYNVGKFIYLIDALDDVGDDAKSGSYNPFLVGKTFENRKKFFADNAQEISFVLACTVNRATECFNSMKFTQSYTLLKNIVYDGLREKVEEVLKSDKKIPNPKI
jgi:hypothetical protein